MNCTMGILVGLCLVVAAAAPGQAQSTAPAAAPGATPSPSPAGTPSATCSSNLTNGISLRLHPMPAAKRVSIALVITGGAVLENQGEHGLTEAAAAAWVRAEIAAPSVIPDEKPQSKPEGVRRLRVEGCPEGVSIRANVAPEQLDAALQAIGTMLRDASCDAERLTRWRERARATAEATSVDHAVTTALMDLLVPDEVPGQGQPLSAARIDAITLESTHKWLHDRIVTAPMELAIAGPIELGAARRSAELALSNLPSREPVTVRTFAGRRVAHRVAGPITQRVEIPVAGGTAHVILGFTGPDLGAIEDVRAMSIATEVARRRLDSLCADDKLSATMCAARLMPARMHPGLGALFVTARVPDTDEATSAAVAALQLLIDDLAISGPTAPEVAEAAELLADDAEKKLTEPDYWAASLSISSLQGLTPDAIAGAPAAYRAMTAAKVHECIRIWCTPANRFSLIARPVAVP